MALIGKDGTAFTPRLNKDRGCFQMYCSLGEENAIMMLAEGLLVSKTFFPPRPALPACWSNALIEPGYPVCIVKATPPTSTPSSNAQVPTTPSSLRWNSLCSMLRRASAIYPPLYDSTFAVKCDVLGDDCRILSVASYTHSTSILVLQKTIQRVWSGGTNEVSQECLAL